MKFPLDMPVSKSLLEILRTRGHDGVHAHEIGLDRAADSQILEVARREGWIIITADLDFPRLLALTSTEGPALILFRGGNYSNAEMQNLLSRVLTEVPAEIIESSICVVDSKRIRITRLPLNRAS